MACQPKVDRSEEENVSTFIYTWKVDKAGQVGAHDNVLNVKLHYNETGPEQRPLHVCPWKEHVSQCNSVAH